MINSHTKVSGQRTNLFLTKLIYVTSVINLLTVVREYFLRGINIHSQKQNGH